MTPAKLAELEEKAKASPEVAFQGDTESDRYSAAANPSTILELIAAYRKAVEALEHLSKELRIMGEAQQLICDDFKHWQYLNRMWNTARAALAEIRGKDE